MFEVDGRERIAHLLLLALRSYRAENLGSLGSFL